MLSRNRRQKTVKSLRHLNLKGYVNLDIIKTYSDYLHYFEEMRSIYIKRWGADLDETIYKYRNSALKALFHKNLVRLYILRLDKKLIAYHLGFEHDKYFYSWKECADDDYFKLSLGNLMRVYLIPEDLINNKFKGINFMAGDYEYKRNRSRESGIEEKLHSFYGSKGILAYMVKMYFLKYRQTIKDIYHKFK